MTYQLFTVSVTALLGSGVLDLGLLDMLAGVVGITGVMDAAVTMDSESISFTGQVDATDALEAMSRAVGCMQLTGHFNISALSVEPCIEEEHESDTLRIAVA